MAHSKVKRTITTASSSSRRIDRNASKNLIPASQNLPASQSEPYYTAEADTSSSRPRRSYKPTKAQAEINAERLLRQQKIISRLQKQLETYEEHEAENHLDLDNAPRIEAIEENDFESEEDDNPTTQPPASSLIHLGPSFNLDHSHPPVGSLILSRHISPTTFPTIPQETSQMPHYASTPRSPYLSHQLISQPSQPLPPASPQPSVLSLHSRSKYFNSGVYEDSEAPASKRPRSGLLTPVFTRHGRPKVSDYDEPVKSMLLDACHFYASKILMIDAYPLVDRKAVWAQQIWEAAMKKRNVDERYKLTSQMLRLVCNRGTWARGLVKTRIRPLVQEFFGFADAESKKVIAENQKIYNAISNSDAFHYKDYTTRSHFAQSQIVRRAIKEVAFYDEFSLGIAYNFNTITLPFLALVLTMIELCISEWATGRFYKQSLIEANNKCTYQKHLERAQQWYDVNPTIVSSMLTKWCKKAWIAVGASQPPKGARLNDDELDQIAHELEEYIDSEVEEPEDGDNINNNSGDRSRPRLEPEVDEADDG